MRLTSLELAMERETRSSLLLIRNREDMHAVVRL